LLIMFLVICFLSEYKEKIGLKCQFLIEPKAKEPMKHQYDYGAALFVDVCYIIITIIVKFISSSSAHITVYT